MSEEKRQHPRIKVKWKARALLPDRSLFEIIINDVSLGGVSVIFPYVLKKNTQMNLEFYVPVNGESRRIRCKTRVVFNVAQANGTARLGAMFVAMGDAEKSALQDFMAAALSQ